MTTLVGGGGPLVNKSFTAADSGDTLSAGPFNITNLSNGNFTVYGNQYQNISFTVSNSVDNTSLVLSGISVDLAGNTIHLGNGNNTVYGNIQDLSFSVNNTSVDSVGSDAFLSDPATTSGIPSPIFGLPTYTTTYDVGIDNVNVELGGNTITVGNGVDTIYGTMRDLNMSDSGGNAVTDGVGTGSQITVNTLINDVTIDLTGGGVGNSITVGNGNNTVYGDMRDMTLTAGGGYANSTGLPASTNFAFSDFTISPNVTASTNIQGLNFTVGDNQITLGNGTNTVYGDMQTMNLTATSDIAIGYNSIAAGGIGDGYNSLLNFFATGRSVLPYFVTPNFNNFNFNSDVITVGNGNNVIYGHLQTINFSEGNSSQVAMSPGDSPVPTSSFDQSALLASIGLPGFLAGTVPYTTISYGNTTMGANTITAGSGVNTIYGDFQTFNNTIIGGTSTGTFPSSPGSTVYTPLNSPFQTPHDSIAPLFNVLLMDGNVIKAGLSGSSTNTIYGTLQDMNFIGVAGNANQSYEDDAEALNMFVLGGTGHFLPGTDPTVSYPNFSANVTGNTITVGNGVNTIYGDMRDLITTDSGGIQNGLNNPLGLNGQPATTNGPSMPSATFGPFDTVNADANEFFLGANHITAGNGVNTIYAGMRDMITVNGGVDINGVITSNSSTIGIIENTPSGDSDIQNFEVDVIVSIAGSTIHVGNGVNTIYGSMRDLTWVNFGGNGINIAPDSFASATAYETLNRVFMGNNHITAGSGVNTIDGDFRNLDWSVVSGDNTVTLAGNAFGSNAGANVRSTILTMGGNTITAGTSGSSSVNVISGDGEDMLYSVLGGTATDHLSSWASISRNNTTMWDNHVDLYGGGVSTVYGDVQSIDWSVTAGHADGAGSYADGHLYQNNITMGGNVITDHGNGSDTIYGDAQTISLSVQGGTVTNSGSFTYTSPLTGNPVTTVTDASTHMIDNTITLAGNTITGGSGNDVIYASLQNLSFSAHGGSGPGTGAYFTGNIVFPDGGSNPSHANSTVVDTGNHITFGNGSINGGGGNDLIIGSDVLNLTGLDAFLKPPGYVGPVTWHNNGDGSVSNDLLGTDLNQITFGNELLTGGLGNDTFEFTLLNGGTKVVANQGAAEVTDLGAKDVVQLNTSLIAEHTAAALDADHVATFTNSAAGCLITFNGAGSIMLDHVNFTSFVQMQTQHHLVVS
jgi:hypothetical protein